MADYNRLPRRWRESFRRYAAASEAALNIALLANPDYHTVYTHFLGDLIPDEWAAAKTNGTSATSTVASSQLTLTPGTDNDGYAGNGFGLFWKGDNGFFMESRQAQATITTNKFEVGVTDAVDAAGAVNVKATPTATATVFCVLVRDTDDNTDLDLISDDNAAGQAAAGLVANAEGVYTVVGGTNFTVEMAGQADAVSAYVNGGHVGSGNIDGSVLLTPWWFNQTRLVTNANFVHTVEYALMTGPNGMS